MAKIKGINHICFAVKNLDEAIKSIEDNFGGELMMKLGNTEHKYEAASIQLGESIISFMQATDESSFVAKFIEEKGEGVQHIGLDVDNLEEFVEHMESKGIKVDRSQMKDEDFPEALVGPKAGYGVVFQLMQWKGGSLDVSPEGKERLKRKYRELPGLKLIE